MLPHSLVEESVRVAVTPSQASYFAGERLSIMITITNTQPPRPGPTLHSPSTQSHHKRGAHSISSVPMARPPTSPGMRTTLPGSNLARPSLNAVVARRGIIGRPDADEAVEKSAQPRRRLSLNQSQSVSLSIHETPFTGSERGKDKSPARASRALDAPILSPTSPRISSPLARSASVPAHHPHARKQSVVDGQVFVQPLGLPTPNASTFSLTLDPITEATTSPISPTTPLVTLPAADGTTALSQMSTSISAPTALHPFLGSASRHTHIHPPQLPHSALGRGPPPIVVQSPKPRAASSDMTTSATELILYSYAQLSGTVSLTPLGDLPHTAEQTTTLQALRRSLLKSRAIGGGSMDITSHGSSPTSSNSPRLGLSTRQNSRTHTRSTSLSGSLLSILSSSSLLPSVPPSQQQTSRISRHNRSPSTLGSLSHVLSSSSSQLHTHGSGVQPTEGDDVRADAPLPTFEVQPTMLAVDLALGPGDARSYIYELDLPRNLPPSYRGRTLKLSYQFILGICRASKSSTTGLGSHSRVMKVPIRIYNYIVVDAPSIPYDLLWPSSSLKDSRLHLQPSNAIVSEVRDSKYQQPSFSPGTIPNDTVESVRDYARELLSHMNEHPIKDSMPGLLHSTTKNSLYSHSKNEQPVPVLSCREAVDVLTRNPKKLSYDVNKDGVNVAVLTFTKASYRLGETVLGVVELNARASRTRVLKLSVMLEAHESLPANLAQPPPNSSRQLRRTHAEHHSSLMTSTLRTTFSLDIPSDASPAFEVIMPASSSGQTATGGLEWKVRLYLLVAVASSGSLEATDGMRLKSLVPDGPRGEWGTTWGAAHSIAPSERPSSKLLGSELANAPRVTQSWTSFFTSALLGSTEPFNQYHDGDEEEEDGEQRSGREEDWREVNVEMVECVVPIRVWPGNTAFKATEVVFEI